MMTVQDGAPQRTMTIKRGMTRLKTIDVSYVVLLKRYNSMVLLVTSINIC
jgi:hypothetical protein